MLWRQKLKGIIDHIPKDVSANEIVLLVIQRLKQRPCYERLFNGKRANTQQEDKLEQGRR
jgi:hypothetical protein